MARRLAFLLCALITAPATAQTSPLEGDAPGDGRSIQGIKLCWCPPGRFLMGSPADEAGHRPDEGQVAVRLTRGFWIGKFEVTQGDWKRIVGALPGKLTEELPA